MGAFVVCDQAVKDYLINTMRPLIFSYRFAAVECGLSHFIWATAGEFSRTPSTFSEHQPTVANFIQQTLGFPMPSATNVVPYIVGENQRALKLHSVCSNAIFMLC